MTCAFKSEEKQTGGEKWKKSEKKEKNREREREKERNIFLLHRTQDLN